MPRLVLHIGTEKTGTTLIQEFLRINKQALELRGFYLPSFLGESNHRWFPVLFYNESRVDEFTKTQIAAEEDNSRKVSIHKKFCEISDAIQLSRDKTWIISSEHLQSRLRTKDEVYRLASFIRDTFSSVRIIIYLREPLDTAISSWSTSVISGGTQSKLPLPFDVQHNCNHKEIVERWLCFFEEHEFCIRLYDKHHFYQQSLLADFCRILGIDYSPRLITPAPQNTTLSHFGLKVLARINQRIPPFQHGRINPKRKNISSFIRQRFTALPRYSPTQDEVSAYREYYHESREWIKMRFFSSEHNLWPGIRWDVGDVVDKGQSDLSSQESLLADSIADLWLLLNRDS